MTEIFANLIVLFSSPLKDLVVFHIRCKDVHEYLKLSFRPVLLDQSCIEWVRFYHFSTESHQQVTTKQKILQKWVRAMSKLPRPPGNRKNPYK